MHALGETDIGCSFHHPTFFFALLDWNHWMPRLMSRMHAVRQAMMKAIVKGTFSLNEHYSIVACWFATLHCSLEIGLCDVMGLVTPTRLIS